MKETAEETVNEPIKEVVTETVEETKSLFIESTLINTKDKQNSQMLE